MHVPCLPCKASCRLSKNNGWEPNPRSPVRCSHWWSTHRKCMQLSCPSPSHLDSDWSFQRWESSMSPSTPELWWCWGFWCGCKNWSPDYLSFCVDCNPMLYAKNGGLLFFFFLLHLVWLIISCFWEFSYVPNVSLGTAATHILPCVQPSFQPIFRRAILFCLCVVIHSYRYAAQSGKAARHSGGFLFFGRYIRITFIVR